MKKKELVVKYNEVKKLNEQLQVEIKKLVNRLQADLGFV